MRRGALRTSNLDQIEISLPCSVPWEHMPGDGRVRFCGECHQSVFNIAGLTPIEVRRLLAHRQGRLCARILRRPDGTVVTADCWSRLRAARRRGVFQFLAVLLLVVVPELFAMRFGLGNLLRLTGPASLDQAPAPAIRLPPRPPLPEETVMVGGIGPDGYLPAKPSPQRQMDDVDDTELSQGLVGHK